MKRRLLLVLLIVVGVLWPLTCFAPLVYRPGQGWTYESVGGGKWVRARAKDQYDVAKQAFGQHKYRLATKAAKRTVSHWPLSDYAAPAQFLLGQCYEARHKDDRAFNEFQTLIDKYPKTQDFDAALKQQFLIAGRFLAGQWFKLWGIIPFFPSMEKTADMYAKIVRNGPYTDIAPKAQLDIGAAREKQRDYELAASAYEKAADIYHDNAKVAATATFRAGLSYAKEAKGAEYDQSAADRAINTFNDFMVMFPSDSRVPQAKKEITTLRLEQALGAFKIAKFYEKKGQWLAARIYYNETINRALNSTYAAEAKLRLQYLDTITSQTNSAKAWPPL